MIGDSAPTTNMRATCFLITLLVIGSFCQAQTADEIISKYVHYIGGASAWKKVQTITASGEYNYGGLPFPFTTYSKAPNLYKLIVPFNGKYYAQAFDGQTGWKIDAFKNETKPTMLSGEEALALANEADVEIESPMINFASKGHRVLWVGKDTAATRTCHVIKLTLKTGRTEDYYFDSQTFALVMKKAEAKNTELQKTPLRIFYSDYQKVEHVLIPFKTVCESNGQTMLTITVKEAVLNKSIENSQFKP